MEYHLFQALVPHLMVDTSMAAWRWEPTSAIHSPPPLALVAFFEVVVAEVETSRVAEEHASDGPGADWAMRSCMYASVRQGYTAIEARRSCGNLIVGDSLSV